MRQFKRLHAGALMATGSAIGLLAAMPAFAQNASASTDQVKEIVVTGTLIRSAPVTSPLSVVDSQAIEARGITNSAELVSAVTANSGSEAGTDQLGQPLTSGTAQFNLRNLGLGSTLVLLNNRRQTLAAVANNDGSTFVDINTLVPLIAIQRVEVVKDGAAATYGSDAVAGVVNFITRRRVEAPEIKVRGNFMDGAEQYNVDGIAGFEVVGGDLVLAASYYQSTRLASGARSFSTASTFGRPGWHSVSSYGQPGSFFVPSLGRLVADPDCTNPAFPESYKTSPTDMCRMDFSAYYDLIPKERRIQAFASFTGDIGESTSLNLEFGYANTRTITTTSPSYPLLTYMPVVPASHPDNPFGEDVLFRGRIANGEFGPTLSKNVYDTFRFAGGLDGDFGEAWNWSVNATYSQQVTQYDKDDTVRYKLINAINGLGGPNCNPLTGTPGTGNCSYYNPFGSSYLGTGTPNSPELIKSLLGSTGMRGKTSLATVDALVSGDLFELGDKSVQAAMGVQYRRSSFRHNWSDLVNAGELINLGQAPDFSGTQETYSVFGEVRVPVASLAELTLSGRYEKYADSFGKFTPKIALLVNPIDEVSLRASWGKAFRAPSVYQQVAVQAAQPGVVDPAGAGFVFLNTKTFGDANLRPEKSTNWNIGGTFRPISNVQLSLDYYRFNYKDLIVKENPQPIINQAFADDQAGRSGTEAQQRVIRDATGNLQMVNLRFINASSVKVEGLDVSAKTWFELENAGRLEFHADWSHVTKYDIRLTGGGAVIDGLGSVNFNNLGHSMPKDRIEYGMGWSLDSHSVNLLGHYVSGYKNDRAGITETRIKASHTFDAQYNYTFDSLGGETTLTVGAINVFDKKPPVAQLFLGFDPTVHDPRGRVIYVGLNQTF